MKLLAYIINGDIVGVDLEKWDDDLLSGNKPFICSESVESGYVDISNIVNWSKFGINTGRDYKFVRNEIKILVIAIAGVDFTNWNNLTENEKIIASEYFCAPYSCRILMHTLQEQHVFAKIFNDSATQSRKDRFDHAISIIRTKLTWDDTQEVVDEMMEQYEKPTTRKFNRNLANNYIYYGREGTVEGDPLGLFDYIEARVGTYYETLGLAAKGYIPETGTLAELVTEIMDILKNGNY